MDQFAVWRNKWSCSALFCLLALMLESIVYQVFPNAWTSGIGIGLCGVALVLMLVAARTAKPPLLPLPEPQEQE